MKKTATTRVEMEEMERLNLLKSLNMVDLLKVHLILRRSTSIPSLNQSKVAINLLQNLNQIKSRRIMVMEETMERKKTAVTTNGRFPLPSL